MVLHVVPVGDGVLVWVVLLAAIVCDGDGGGDENDSRSDGDGDKGDNGDGDNGEVDDEVLTASRPIDQSLPSVRLTFSRPSDATASTISSS